MRERGRWRGSGCCFIGAFGIFAVLAALAFGAPAVRAESVEGAAGFDGTTQYAHRGFGGTQTVFDPTTGAFVSVLRVRVSEYMKCMDAGVCTAPRKYVPEPDRRLECGCSCLSDRAEGLLEKAGIFLAGLARSVISFNLGYLRYAVGCRCSTCDEFPERLYNYGSPHFPETTALNGVTFEQALAYCRWIGGRLPTAEEWRSASTARARVGGGLPFKPFSEMDGWYFEWTSTPEGGPLPKPSSGRAGSARKPRFIHSSGAESERVSIPKFFAVQGCSSGVFDYPAEPKVSSAHLCGSASAPIRADGASPDLFFRCAFSAPRPDETELDTGRAEKADSDN